MAAVRPKRKIRIRILPVVGYIVAALGLAWILQLQATTTIIFVPHADVDVGAPLTSDTPLNARGQRRAQLLADFLADVDVVASVDAIYATTAKRTQQTAAPLAERLRQRLNIDDPYRVERFMHRVLRDRSGKITLVVTDADAIAPMIEELHGSKRVPAFGPEDYGELYVVTIPSYGKVKTLRFNYGEPGVELEPHGDATSSASGLPR
jgi:phosphohistidine phosphatase SixA